MRNTKKYKSQFGSYRNLREPYCNAEDEAINNIYESVRGTEEIINNIEERIRVQNEQLFLAKQNLETHAVVLRINTLIKPDIEMKYELNNTFSEYNDCFRMLDCGGYRIDKEKKEAFIKQFSQELWDELWDLHTSSNSVILGDENVELEFEQLLSIGGDVISERRL